MCMLRKKEEAIEITSTELLEKQSLKRQTQSHWIER